MTPSRLTGVLALSIVGLLLAHLIVTPTLAQAATRTRVLHPIAGFLAAAVANSVSAFSIGMCPELEGNQSSRPMGSVRAGWIVLLGAWAAVYGALAGACLHLSSEATMRAAAMGLLVVGLNSAMGGAVGGRHWWVCGICVQAVGFAPGVVPTTHHPLLSLTFVTNIQFVAVSLVTLSIGAALHGTRYVQGSPIE